MSNLIFCLQATVPIFAVILLGYLLRRRGFFPGETAAAIDRLVFKVLLPVLLFRDIAAGRITEQFNLRFFLFCAGATTVCFFASWLFAAKTLPDKHMVGAFTQGAFRSSQAVLGVAFVQNLYGEAGFVPLMIVATVPLYNIYSVLVLSVTAPRETQSHGVVSHTLGNIITNPIILGILAGLPFSLLGIELPTMAARTIDSLAVCGTPLALLSIGAGFEGAKAIQKLKPTCMATLIKLIVMPAVFLPLGWMLGFRGQAAVALLILFGAPSTVSGYIMAKNMDGDYRLSSSIIVLSTALSAFTLTLALYLMRVTGMI